MKLAGHCFAGFSFLSTISSSPSRMDKQASHMRVTGDSQLLGKQKTQVTFLNEMNIIQDRGKIISFSSVR